MVIQGTGGDTQELVATQVLVVVAQALVGDTGTGWQHRDWW